MEKLRVGSFFSGIGAFEKALERLEIPHRTVFYCEIDKYASKSYSLIHNVPESLNLWDITKVNEQELPDFDLMTWGFPCTDISVAGKQEGFVNADGNKTRSGLYYDGLRILKHKMPKYSIIENVKNLTSEKFRPIFHQILCDLEDAGYHSYYEVLNAKDYGIPQNRERVFIVSIRKDVDQGFMFPRRKFLTTCVGDFIKEDFRLMTSEQIESVNVSTYESREFVNSDGICPTLMTRDYKDSGKYFIYNGQSVKSNAIVHLRLMGFDDADYWLCKNAGISDSQLYKMAGNSIVVQVLEGMLNNLFKKSGANVPDFVFAEQMALFG